MKKPSWLCVHQYFQRQNPTAHGQCESAADFELVETFFLSVTRLLYSMWAFTPLLNAFPNTSESLLLASSSGSNGSALGFFNA